MPADYVSTARALSLSPRLLSPSPPIGDDQQPSWQAPRLGSVRRLSSVPQRSKTAFVSRVLQTIRNIIQSLLKAFLSLPPLKRILVALSLCAVFALSVVFLVYSHAIFASLGPVAKHWRSLPAGWLIVWVITFMTSFPPMIGYSTAATVGGFVYGFPLGWPIVASASTAGSLAAFLASRTIFSGFVNRLVGRDHRFLAFGQVLRQDGLAVLTMIRFCPLPFSLSNGFLATIPSINPWAFTLSTALASPKLLIHVFVGSRMAVLVEEGDTLTTGDKVVNYLGMFIGGMVGLAVGWLVYQRTMKRAAELAQEDAEEEGRSGLNETHAHEFDDPDTALLDPEDAAALMSDVDAISLWETDGPGGGYQDEETTFAKPR